jgi:hypothetical protein
MAERLERTNQGIFEKPPPFGASSPETGNFAGQNRD